MLLRSIYYRVGINHHAEVLHVVTITLRHHTHNVLAYVMHIAFDSSHEYGVVGRRLFTLIQIFHIRLQHRHRFLHHASRLHHLWQEHLALAKEFAHLFHCWHQVVVYHAQCRTSLLISLLCISLDIVRQSLEHSLGNAVFYTKPCLDNL